MMPSVRAELDRLGDLRQRDRFGRLVDELAGLRDDRGVRRLDGNAARVAAATSSKASGQGGSHALVEAHVPRVGQTRRA